MTRPPDINQTTPREKAPFQTPKFIVIKRKDNIASFEKVSPFIIKKVIDYTCCGEVTSVSKTKAGTLLVKTKDLLQAQWLMKLTKFHDFEVEASEHKTLNFSKGVIYSNDLRYINNEDILNELKTQNVTEVNKILRKKDNNLEETGLIILTFATTTLPETINIGYERVKIRPHIPRPLKCRNCQKFNHPTKACNNEKTCSNCSEVHSPDDEDCTKPKFCINCKHLDNRHHSPLDKK